MICTPKPSRFNEAVAVLALALLGMPPLSVRAADFKPAPQEFRQEVPRHWPLPADAASGGFTLVDAFPDGSVRVSDGQRWFAVGGDKLEALPPPAGAKVGDGWILVGKSNHLLPVPLADVRQIRREGNEDVAWLATAKGVLILAADGQPVFELSGQDVRQVAKHRGLVLAATAHGLLQRGSQGNWNPVQAVDEGSRAWTF